MASFCYRFKIRLRLYRRMDRLVQFRLKMPKKSRLFTNGRYLNGFR